MRRKQTEPYISTYLHARGRRLGLPISGNFELTARCNFNCPMCYVHLNQEDLAAQGKELTTAQWIDLARQARVHKRLSGCLSLRIRTCNTYRYYGRNRTRCYKRYFNP